MLALGSKAAMIAKSGGGLSGLAKGAGLLAVGGVDPVMLHFHQDCIGCGLVARAVAIMKPVAVHCTAGGAAAAVSSRPESEAPVPKSR